MEVIKNLLTLRPPSQSKEIVATAPSSGTRSLQSQFEAQTARLREFHRAQRPKNTLGAYEPKQKEWRDWCAGLDDNTDGAWVTEDKLCLFFEQEVINGESRAPGYQAREAKRREMWEDGERAKKRQKTAELARKEEVEEEESEEGIKRPRMVCSMRRSDLQSSTAMFPPSPSYMRGNPKEGSPRRR
jgi:hypothetical protein